MWTFLILVVLIVGTFAAPSDDVNEVQVDQIPVPHPSQLGYVLMDDMWFFNGTRLGQEQKGVTKWTRGRIPYEFESSYPENARQNVRAAIDKWNSELGGCIAITKRKRRDKQFVRIHNSDGCNAAVGRQPEGGQWMSLNEGGCTSQGPVMHEFMHSAGFMHEHQRPDRDEYITVHYENIVEDWRKWWEVDNSIETIGPFNCESLMMYPAYASYSIDGKPAFTGKNGHRCSGDYHHDFASTDIDAIKRLYNC